MKKHLILVGVFSVAIVQSQPAMAVTTRDGRDEMRGVKQPQYNVCICKFRIRCY